MEIDEKLSYTLWVVFCLRGWCLQTGSLQFDPAPRAGEPLVSRRVPDYFLVRVGVHCVWWYLLLSTVIRVDDWWLIVYIVSSLCILGMDCYEDNGGPKYKTTVYINLSSTTPTTTSTALNSCPPRGNNVAAVCKC